MWNKEEKDFVVEVIKKHELTLRDVEVNKKIYGIWENVIEVRHKGDLLDYKILNK